MYAFSSKKYLYRFPRGYLDIYWSVDEIDKIKFVSFLAKETDF